MYKRRVRIATAHNSVYKRYTHSDLVIHYRNGEYILAEKYDRQEIKIPQESRIIKIDGITIDTYIKSLQHKIWLRFDAKLKQSFFFHPSPFCVAGDTSVIWKLRLFQPHSQLALQKKIY